MTEAQTVLAVNRYYYKAWRAGKELFPQMMPEYAQLINGIGHPKALALQVDADLGSDATNGLASITTTEGTDNVDITEDVLLAGITDLNNVFAPNNDRFIVFSPASQASLFKVESLKNSLYNATVGSIGGDMGLGYAGSFLGMQAWSSGNLAAGTNGKKNAIFQREAIAYAEQLSVMTDKSTNIQDGNYEQFITFMTCGFIKVKDNHAALVLGK